MTPAWLLAIALGAAACGMTRDVTLSAEDSAELQDRAVRVEQWLSDTSMGPATGVPIARWILPSALNEISGLALTSDGNLLAHGDEIGRISVVDPRRGVILKEFSIGAKGDFEGITVANGTIYLVTSNGQIYSFREGGPGERVSYQLHDTRLGNECEFEGIAYDARREAMLLPCKNVHKKSLRSNIVIYIWNPDPSSSPRVSVLTVPLRNAIGSNQWATLRPTDITIDPRTGNYVLVAAQERGILEVTPNGAVVQSFPLPGGAEQHAQPEGIAISEDGMLIIADEAARRAASITIYRWPIAPGSVAP
jgi:uncharacterized protein YjiK